MSAVLLERLVTGPREAILQSGDFSRRSQNWYTNANGHRITDLGTDALQRCKGFNTIQFELREGDGNGGVPSGTPSERAELQGGRRGQYGVPQWWRWVSWFPPDFPIPVDASWAIAGCPGQFHNSSGGGQPPLAWEIRGGNLALRITNGSGYKNWVYQEPLARGQEVEWRMMVVWHTSSSIGRLVLIRNGQKVFDRSMATNYSTEVPYPKAGFYRAATVNTNFLMKVGGCQVFDQDPGPFDGAAPEPVPTDTAGPTLRVVSPLPGAVLVDRKLTWKVEATDPSGVREVKVLAGDVVVSTEVAAPYGDGSPVNIPTSVPDGMTDFAVVATDTVGNVTRYVIPGVFVGSPPEPEGIDLVAVRGDVLAARNRLAGVEEWTNLTDAQRDSVGDARRRLDISLGRDGWPV